MKPELVSPIVGSTNNSLNSQQKTEENFDSDDNDCLIKVNDLSSESDQSMNEKNEDEARITDQNSIII